MNEIMKAYASVSVSAALLAVILLLFRPLYKQTFSKRWQYYIWLIVVARFLIPWNPGTGLVGHFFQQASYPSAEMEGQEEPAQEPLLQETAISPQGADQTAETNGTAENYTSENDDNKNRLALPAVWLLTALVLMVRKITAYQSFVTYLKAGCSPVEDIRRLEVFGNLTEQNHIKRVVGLYTNCLTASPLLVGLIHPAVILTKAELSDTEFYYTVLHELTHYRRRDLCYKWLVQITVCLHWFNPFVYLMAYEVSRLCELSCDEAVTDRMDAQSKRAYGDTLLHAMRAGGIYSNSMASMTFGGGKQLLKERLGEMMKTKKRSKRITAAAFAAALLLAGSAVAAGAYVQPAAAGKQKQEIRLSDCRMIEKNGNYYILSEDAAESDIPTGGVTKGYVSITLVHQDGYKTIGPFEHLDQLVREVKRQVRQMRKKNNLTAKEAALFTQAAEKIQADALEEAYAFTSITKKKGAYYYRGSRIRIFMDQRMDQSFVNFKYDEHGEIDICLQRTEDFSIAAISFLTEEEAEEILEDLEVSANKKTNGNDQAGTIIGKSDADLTESKQQKDANQGLYVKRLAKNELPEQIKKEIARCKDRTWYMIKNKDCTYLYYSGLPNDYAFEPVISKQKAKIKIADMKGSGSEVLLAVYGNMPVTVTYQNKKAACQEILVYPE